MVAPAVQSLAWVVPRRTGAAEEVVDPRAQRERWHHSVSLTDEREDVGIERPVCCCLAKLAACKQENVSADADAAETLVTGPGAGSRGAAEALDGIPRWSI